MLHHDGKIPAEDIDITFAIPTRDWVAAVSRPTVNFYLYDISENVRLRANEFEARRTDTREVQHLRPRRIDLKYVVNAYFKAQLAELDDQEWLILWRVLTTLMRNSDWPEALLPPEARALRTPLQGLVCHPEAAPRPSDIWSTLGTTPRPGLHYVLTVPLDLNIEFMHTLVLEQNVRFRDLGTGEVMQTVRRTAWRLRDASGAPVAGAEVRLPDHPGLSLSDEAGVFSTSAPHAEVPQLLIRRPGRATWDLVPTRPGETTVILETEDETATPPGSS
ncbi:hypothetical protein DEIPH_ctg009orf0020 [Deinococcus phoenicis]|uniref:Pvc16 N-terminal domain-containing protein n=2 Tax=Deinococcus phoenicis TaxID=1476583 RepID=A0A016QU03_9DEIO|nr:hypothetical protein DEIPH_ctg009orf0020 [Deinococcus phoenicis]